jgi:hypothetical protein
MGVDVSLKVRLIQNDSTVSEIEISEQDNSLAGIFDNSGTVSYTSLKIIMTELFSEDELRFLVLNEEDEMMSSSIQTDASSLLKSIKKIERSIFKSKRTSLLSDLAKVDEKGLTADKIQRQKEEIIVDYFHFESSLSSLIGILNTASNLNFDVQIIGEYY